jgi:hypothetical protein
MASDLEELDLISAIWILSSNDENHLITFEGIRERLGLEESFDVKGLVLKRRELFRPGAPPGELEDWQASMRNGSRLPTWIKLIDEGPKRSAAIDGFSQKDVFRSQFRANRGAPKSQVEIVSWGLEHIDRLRKSRIAARDASVKSWQMWLVFGIGVANILATIAVAYMNGNENTPPKPATAVAQPIVSGDAPQAGVRPPAPRP